MLPEELISRSPLRILEKSTHGGVGKGNIGVIAARKGVGKTACLVHMAIDRLFQNKHVIHVSFAADTSHIVTWYEEIYLEIRKRYNLEETESLHDKLTQNRVIMNFRQNSSGVSRIRSAILAMVNDGHFCADLIVVDGYDFSSISPEEFAVLKEMAEDLDTELWFSATIHRESEEVDETGIPAPLSPFKDSVAILIRLEPRREYIHLHLLKDHEILPAADDLHLKLDPQLLLIAEE